MSDPFHSQEPRIGRAPHPLPPDLARAIGKVVGSIPEIFEAHTPIIHTPPFNNPPMLALAVVTHQNVDPQAIVERLAPALAAAVPHGDKLPIMPLHDKHPNLAAVREVDRRIEIIAPGRNRA